MGEMDKCILNTAVRANQTHMNPAFVSILNAQPNCVALAVTFLTCCWYFCTPGMHKHAVHALADVA